MAVIGKIRQRSWILVGSIGVILFIFIIQAALGDSGLFGGGSRDNSVGKIDGKTISGKEYSERITGYEDGLKLINPSMQLNDQVRSQIQQEVWNTVAANQLLDKAYKAFGLQISEGEIADLMWGNQPHPLAQRFLMKLREVKPDIISQSGQLDQAKIKAYIADLDKIDAEAKSELRPMLSYVENLIKDDQLKQKYASLVSQSFYMPTFMAKEVVNSSRSAKVAFVSVPYSSLADDKYKVTDDEITGYLKENKAKYEQEAARVVDVVAFDVIPSSADTQQTLTKISKMRDDYVASLPKDSAFIARNSQQGANLDFYTKEELAQTKRNTDTLFALPVGTLTGVYKEGPFYMFTKIVDRKVAPDTVRAAQIVLSAGKGSDDELKAANNLADSLIRVIASNQKNFGQVASESSIDPNTKTKGGDLGYFTKRTTLPQPVDEKVFYSGMQPGQIVKVEVQGYIFIVLMIDAKAPKVATKFADFVVELVPSSETEKLAYDNAVSFQQKNPTADQFDKAAKTQNVYKNIVLSQNMVDVQQLGPARKLVQWAFQQNKPKAIDFFDNDSRYMVAKLSKVIAKGLPKAEDVREEMTTIIRNEKKGKDLVAQLNKAATGTTDLAAIAAKVPGATVTDTALIRFSSAYVQGLNNEPKLVGTTFGVPVGKTSKAVAGDNAAFIVQPKSVEEKSAQAEDGNINMYKQQMQGMYTSRLNFQSIFESILKKSKVEDTRYKFY